MKTDIEQEELFKPDNQLELFEVLPDEQKDKKEDYRLKIRSVIEETGIAAIWVDDLKSEN